jgi:hypothetical protein
MRQKIRTWLIIALALAMLALLAMCQYSLLFAHEIEAG